MVNNCNRRPYLLKNDEQQKRKCNRFMAKFHFDKSTALIVLFVSVFLFPYQYQVLADNITHTANDEKRITDHVVEIPEEITQLSENSELKTKATINHENNATNIEFNHTSTGFEVDNVVSTHFPHHEGHEQLKTNEELTTSIPAILKEELFNSVEHTVDVNNNIYTDVEERADNEILPDLVNSNHENTISNENLEESIRNSVKTEIELEQNLESSPVLEILKDLPEAEIRKTLTADIMSLDQENFDTNFKLLPSEENFEPIPEVRLESIENISEIVESSEIKTENPRESRNLMFQDAENSSESSNIPDPEQLLVESLKADNTSLTFSLENNNSENSGDTFKTNETALTLINQEPNEQITNMDEVDLTVTETTYELTTEVNSSTDDFSFLIDEETEDNGLSIVLNETFSTAEPYSGEENPIRIDDNVELTTKEQVEIITVIPEELEHIVVKKVLDDQGIFDDILVTTIIPFEQQTQITDVGEQSLVENNDEDYNQESNSKLNDRKAKLMNNDQNTETDNYNQELNTKQGNDHEAKLLDEDQNSEVESIDDIETKLIYEDQSSVEQNTENTEKLLESQVISSHNDEQSINLNNQSHTYSKQEQQEQHQSYPNNDPEDTKLQTNKESQSLHNHLKLVDRTDNPLHSEIKSPYDKAATFFEAYLPRDSGQTFNNNLADEFAGIGKALPISISDGSSRSTIIIVLSSGTAVLFVVISLTIFLISFQRQNGTLDIEMQERSCGKDDLDDEDVETFSKLLEVELPRSVALALDDTEECL